MSMQTAIIIKVDGTKEAVSFTIGNSYQTLRDAVGGYIECVSLPARGVDMWVNEEGKLIPLPQNPIGTALWNDEYGLTDVVCGDIIITGGADDEGETLGLNPQQVADIMQYDRKLHYLGWND